MDKPLRYILAGGLSQFGSALSFLAFLTIAVKDDPVLGVSLLTGSFYFAVGLSGVFAGIVQKIVSPVLAIRTIELLRASILLIFCFSTDFKMWVVVAVALILYFLEGVFHPFRYHVFRSQMNDEIARMSFFSRLQSIEGSLSIVAPIAAGLLITFVPINLVFLIDAASFGFSFIVWASFRADREISIQNLSWLAGYREIFVRASLRYMTLARMLGNVMFVFWSLALPLWLLHGLSDESDFGSFQGSYLGLTAVGLMLINLVRPPRLQPEANFLDRALFFGVAGSLVLFAVPNSSELSWVVLGFAALLTGAANGALRTGGILVGQRITPSGVLHLVIAAGDSLVRLVTACIAFGFGYFFEAQSLNSATRLGAIASLIFVTLAVCLYRKSRFIDEEARLKSVEITR